MDTSTHTSSHMARLTTFYLMFLFAWQTLFRVSDAGISILLGFFSKFKFTHLLGVVLHIQVLKELAEQIPTNVRNAKKYIGTLSDTFHKYAACPKCHSVYVLDTCKVNSSNNTIVSRKCNYIQFPNHPHSLQRSRCDTLLMKIVRSSQVPMFCILANYTATIASSIHLKTS